MSKVAGICGECGKYYQGNACPKCQDISTGETINIIPDITPHFNRGLGEMVNSRSDYRVKLRDKGMIEVGNEFKYVDPVIGRRNREKETEMKVERLRPAAYQILESYGGNPGWN